MNKTQDVKLQNISAVVRCIEKDGPISKNKIAATLGLTIMTVNNLVTELCECGICRESGKFVSNGGRRAVLYQLNGDFGYIIGAQLARTHIGAAVYDLDFNCIGTLAHVRCDLSDVASSLNILKARIREAIKLVPGKNILGVGITVPGRVSDTGVSIPEYPVWQSVDLPSVISESVHLPVIADNDTNALALSFKWNDISHDTGDFVYMRTDGGIGAGVVLGGNVFYGSGYGGSEIGHTTLHPHGRKCKCGREGCLETYACVEGRLSELGCRDVSEAIELYKSGNSLAKEIFTEAAEYLALTFINTAKLYDPRLIIFENSWLCEIPSLLEEIQNSFFSALSGRSVSLLYNRNKKISESASAAIIFERFMQEPTCDSFSKRRIV